MCLFDRGKASRLIKVEMNYIGKVLIFMGIILVIMGAFFIISSTELIILAGTPATKEFLGTSEVTTEPAAIIDVEPIVTPG